MKDQTDSSAYAGGLVAGRYALGRSLGVGGMSQVYAARDTVLERDVALKLFGPAIDAAGPDRERSEMRTLAALTHPRLVTVHDAGSDTSEFGEPRAYLVMALIDGPSLATVLRDGPLPPDRVAHIGAGVADALDYIHARGVVHRDVKPANILLDTDGEPHLADFGIAQTLGDAALTQVGLTLGTAAYLSPEQVRGQTASPASDIYALGLVLLECLTGRREYPGVTAETALARLTRPPVVDTGLAAPWPRLLTAMTATECANRPSAAEVAIALATGVYEGSVVDDLSITTVLPVEPVTTLGKNPREGRAQPGDGNTRVFTAAVPLVPAGGGRALPRVARTEAARQTGPARRSVSRRALTMVGLAAVGLLVLVLAISALRNTGSKTGVTDLAPGPPGPSRLGPDLDRLHRLVQP